MKIGMVDAGGGLRGSRMEYCVVAADAETGEARYFGKEDIGQDNYDVLKASSSIPFVCRPYPSCAVHTRCRAGCTSTAPWAAPCPLRRRFRSAATT